VLYVRYVDVDDLRWDKPDQGTHTQSHWAYLEAVDEFCTFHELCEHYRVLPWYMKLGFEVLLVLFVLLPRLGYVLVWILC